MTANKIGSDLYLAQTELADPGNAGTISVNKSLAICNLVSAGAETRTLPLPYREGVVITIFARTVGGTITLTVTGGIDLNGTTTFAFTAVDQYLVLESFRKADGTLIWLKVSDYAIGNLTPAASGGASANVVNGIASGYKIARGEHTQVAASDTVATGLATVVACVVTPRTYTVNQQWFGASPGDQAGSPAAGSILINSWKATNNTNDTTPTAATTFSDNIKVDWIAIGT